VSYSVVIPTAGRESLGRLLRKLGSGPGPLPERVLVVDDRRDQRRSLDPGALPPGLADRVRVLRGSGRGPAAARNVGWREARGEWVGFLDDDVEPAPGWREQLARDLEVGEDVAGSEGQIVVPLPRDRRPTDWERNTAALESARWATADLAYRRSALAAVGGFDERFERAYREDADLGLRVTGAGWRIASGTRRVLHPPRTADPLASVRLQAGNADDVLMRALHGPGWRERAGAPAGRLPRHLAVAAAGAMAATGAATRRPRLAAIAAALWLAGTVELAWARIAPGPRTRTEIATMLLTSALLPPAAAWHWARGQLRRGRLLRDTERAPRPVPEAVLLDRDGTLIHDVPYNGDPGRVRPLPGVREALDRLRSTGLRLAVVSNQSGVGRGLIGERDVAAVNRRIEELLGPLGPWFVCPHAPDEGCDCRKPRPGLVLRAAERLGVPPERCVVIGDVGADVEAARAAGARAVIVPTPRTRPEEVSAAPEAAASLGEAVERLVPHPEIVR
jgi:histidinol-phosphate phosphatase family protein